MIQLDYKSGISICEQIVNGIVKLKALGVMKSGEKLPSVRALASKLAVNPNTVQKAYLLLEERKIICTVKGKGSFISDDETVNGAIKAEATENFAKAVKAALSLGLTKEELIKTVKGESDI